MVRPMPSKEKQDADELALNGWFTRPDADLVVRRHQVWTLLGWYHRRVVQPQLGFAGGFRRLWWQLTGRGHLLLSPWEQIRNAMENRRAQREAAKARHDNAFIIGTVPAADGAMNASEGSL